MSVELNEVVLILIASTLISVILSSLIIFSLFIAQRRKFRHRKELIELKSNYDQEVLRTQLETQAQTFETISQELHDNVGTLVSMSIVHLKSPIESREIKIVETQALLEEALEILRDISRSINPENIRRRGIEQSIRYELDRIRRLKTFKTEYSSEGVEFSIDPQKQVILFRIIQEGLNNIVKHSGGDHIAIHVKFAEPLLTISLTDNGKGFDVRDGSIDTDNHSGVVNMSKRAKLINGRLTIKSELDKGTRITLEYPVDHG